MMLFDKFVLATARLTDTFSVRVLAEEQGSKPDLLPYGESSVQLGVSAEQALAFENSPIEVASASSAGILTIGVATKQKPKDLKKSGAAPVIRVFTGAILWTVSCSQE